MTVPISPPPHPRKISWIAARALAFALLGAATTVLIAWTCAIAVRVPPASSAWLHCTRARVYVDVSTPFPVELASPTLRRSPTFDGPDAEWGQPSVWVTRWTAFGSAYFSSGTDAGLTPRAPGTVSIRELVPRDLRPRVAPWLHGHASWPASDATQYTLARGWPWPALWCEYITTTGAPWNGHPVGGVELPWPPVSPGWYLPPPPVTALPYRPLWRGLAGNTVVFAALWWTMWTSAGSLRRAHRRRRGRCAFCGYDLHATPPSAPCPECGRAKAAATPPG